MIVLCNVLESEKRRRTIEILKFRGTSLQRGEFPFTIVTGNGSVVSPLSAMELKQRSSSVRIVSSNGELDRMCGSGFSRDSILLRRQTRIHGEMRRGVTVLKMRGSMHDEDIREFPIDAGGMHIGKPLRNVVGIFAGHPQHVLDGDLDRLQGLSVE